MSHKRFQRECRNWMRRYALGEAAPHAFLHPPNFGAPRGFGGGPPLGSPQVAGPGGSMAVGGGGQTGIGNAFPWLYPTADFQDLYKFNAVALPPNDGATVATIVSFKVDNGRIFKLTQWGIDFVANGGAAFTQGLVAPQLTFSLQVDGKPLRDLGAFSFLPGSVSAPTPTNGSMLREGRLVTLTVVNSAGAAGIAVTTQSIAALFKLYSFNKKHFPKQLGFE